MPLHCSDLLFWELTSEFQCRLSSSFYGNRLRILNNFCLLKFLKKMSARNLRSGTRRDYLKMNEEGVNGALDDSSHEFDEDACAAEKNVNKNKNKNGDMMAVMGMLDLGNCSKYVDKFAETLSSTSSEDDEEIQEARAQLQVTKMEQKKIRKQAKLQQIALETERVNLSMKKMKARKSDGSSKKKTKTTIKALRKSDEVMDEVDELMDRNLNIEADSSDVVDSASSSCSSDCTTSDSSEEERKKKKKLKKREKKTKKTAGLHRSGKSKKLTSFVKYPQMWPHTYLSQNFVSQNKKYEELNIPEFCAGYMAILENEDENGDKDVLIHRVAHLKDLMYFATQYKWRSVLNFHAACLLEVERGSMKWGKSFQRLESTTLANNYLLPVRGPRVGGRPFESSGSKERVLFCIRYQKGTCSEAKDHQGNFYGESKLLKHICATCYQKSGTQATHPENSEDCPVKDQ